MSGVEQTAQVEKCDVQYARHPTMPDLVAVCAKPAGHDGEHSNVLPKTLASLLGNSTTPGESPGHALIHANGDEE